MECVDLVQNATTNIVGVNQNAMWEFAIEQRSRCLGASHSEAMLLSASPNLPFVENCRVRKFLTMRRTAHLKSGMFAFGGKADMTFGGANVRL
jgi:hypothetical protein